MSKTSPAQFLRQVKQETNKVTWSTKKEVVTATITVLVMIIITAGFFWIIDSIIFKLIRIILGM